MTFGQSSGSDSPLGLTRRVSEPLWEGSANVLSDQSDRPQCATYAFATVVDKMLSLNYGLRIDRYGVCVCVCAWMC
jgi:hypothetical protein